MLHTVDVAESQFGIQEDTGNNDGIPAKRYMRGSKLPWCCGFICWSNDNSDDPKIANTVKKFWSWGTNVRSLEEKMMKTGQWYGKAITPERNDLIFFKTRGQSDPGRGRHVGIVTHVDDAYVYTIEGNLGNAVKRGKYKRSSARISGYAKILMTL